MARSHLLFQVHGEKRREKGAICREKVRGRPKTWTPERNGLDVRQPLRSALCMLTKHVDEACVPVHGTNSAMYDARPTEKRPTLEPRRPACFFVSSTCQDGRSARRP